jgi:chemotaxis signal transduction protein
MPETFTSLAPMARSQPLAGGQREFLVFVLAGELYAVELARIREIVGVPVLTHVPRAPRDVIGIFSNRGLLVTVVDLRSRLRLEQRETTRLSRILLSQTDPGEVVGLFVDEVKNVVRLDPEEVELANNVFGTDVSDHILGIGRPAGEAIVLLDINSVVT